MTTNKKSVQEIAKANSDPTPTINVTLAIRKALRRYLGIEPAVPNSEMG